MSLAHPPIEPSLTRKLTTPERREAQQGASTGDSQGERPSDGTGCSNSYATPLGSQRVNQTAPSPSIFGRGWRQEDGQRRLARCELYTQLQSLLEDLATLTRNRVRTMTSTGGKPLTFDLLARPTALQSRAFELLDVPLTM